MHDDDPTTEYTTLEGLPYVRLIADFGDSPVWAWEAVGYEDLDLAEDLERRMRSWAEACGEGGSRDPEVAPEAVVQRLRAEGILLAQLLAEHLGSPLAVEFAPAGPRCEGAYRGGVAEGGAYGRGPYDEDAEAAGAYGEGHAPPRSLADPEIFHVGTVPARPPAPRPIVWMLRHAFEVPGLGE